MKQTIRLLEHFHQSCSDELKSTDNGLFGFWRRFGSVTGFFKPAPSPKPRQKPKILAAHRYIFSVNALRLALAALLFAATSPALLAAPPNAGIQGRAALYISYGKPVEVAPGVWVGVGDLMLPVATSFNILSARSGHKVGHFSVDASGAFTVSLPPGKYIVVPDTLTVRGFPSSDSISTDSFAVTVRARKFAYALILYYQGVPSGVAVGMTH
ncbi:MAG TPA: hypothetical protein VH597_03850 [Verrucomicrobiae bacterium]|jgi:hypothetical protein|nr:hypothetical protein [Verrucomicrobiae bacterium]